MFESAVLTNPSKRVWSTCAGMTAQALLVIAIGLAPVIRPDVLPRARLLVSLMAPGAPERPAPAEPPRHATQVAPTRTFHLVDTTVRLPGPTPPHVAIIDDPPVDVSGPCVGCMIGNGPANIAAQYMNSPPVVPIRPPEPRVVSTQPTEPVQIRLHGGDVRLAHTIYRVEPRYPQVAITARVSGPVELEGIIGTDGHIRDLRALSGSPLLVPAALEAVRQWIYEPTLLNGKPVEVIAPITVIFRLTR